METVKEKLIEEYFVIRDKNTGMYFRGKGANRWGKYYNQATIYRRKGTAEHTLKEIAWNGEQAEIVPIQIIENGVTILECGMDCKNCWKTKLVNPVQEWVSVDERLPEEEGKYIVCTAKNTVYCAKYHAKGKFFGTDMHTHITHWMPLPAPPKGVQ